MNQTPEMSERSAKAVPCAPVLRSRRRSPDVDLHFQENIPLAKKIAGLYSHTSLPKDEALQEAMVGLYLACLYFDSSRGFKFSTYAWPIVRRQIRKALSAHIAREPTTDPQAIAEYVNGGISPVHRNSVNLDCLTQIERTVIERRFGFGQAATTVKAIGRSLGLSRQRIHQVIAKGIEKLRRRERRFNHGCADAVGAEA
jgi:DNA-directed RNA polymerase sigma subunit (sigma70/sigma32)